MHYINISWQQEQENGLDHDLGHDHDHDHDLSHDRNHDHFLELKVAKQQVAGQGQLVNYYIDVRCMQEVQEQVELKRDCFQEQVLGHA